ncbi:hypothetical protein C8F01DRAFT_292364 [Mycena amicta]|nr:hypothetical protein C8F01DRAFT_292364 [Mycena amicta]
MVLQSRPRLSDADNYKARLEEAAKDPETLVAVTGSLAVAHYRKLSPGALSNHARVMCLWEKFIELREARDGEVVLTKDLVENTPAPSDEIIKEFARFMAIVIQGRITKYASKRTILSYIYTFFAEWRRKTFELLPLICRNKAIDYVLSSEFGKAAAITTQSRVKKHADVLDVTIILNAIFQDRRLMRSNQARVMMMYAILIVALSTERPGAVVECGSYRGTNECIVWGDHEFWVIPNPASPKHPLVALILTIRLLKGLRENESSIKQFFILQEPDSHRLVDTLMYAVVLAIQDGIFENVSTVEEIFNPSEAPDAPHCLSIKPEKRSLPVIRRDKIIDGKWSVKHEFAMPYAIVADRLRQLSLAAGFSHWMTFYCIRRGTANKLDSQVTAAERRMLMGHKSNSEQFYANYMARLGTTDLGAILAERTDAPDVNNSKIMKLLTGMARDRDPNAPLALSAAELAAINAEPDLVDLRSERQQVLDKFEDERIKLAGIGDDDDEAHKKQCDLVDSLSQEAKTLQRRHLAIVVSETRCRLREKRKKYFEGASARQLSGEKPAEIMPMAAATSSNTTRTANEHAHRLPVITDPLQQAHIILTSFTLESAPAEHFMTCANTLLGLPTHPSPLCYPGEGPTDDCKCAVCKMDLSPNTHTFSAGNMATHIHKCVLSDAQVKATEELDKAYIPQSCRWKKCPMEEHVWATRTEYAVHLRGHAKAAKNAGKETARCLWAGEDGECRALDCSEEHFGRVHDINVWPEVRVQYDIVSSEIFLDVEGHGDYWRERCNEHFMGFYHPYATRGDADVDFSQTGVNYTDPQTNCITFENGESLGGERPEYHGHIERLVALAPAFCPFCAHDEELEIEVRMAQFSNNKEYQVHLKLHESAVIANLHPSTCPVPSCGPKTFDSFDLLTHMITYHRYPRLADCRRRSRTRPAGVPRAQVLWLHALESSIKGHIALRRLLRYRRPTRIGASHCPDVLD